ncbi:MAG: WG repeat-containing protein [Clostridia bacterium]|nr:WG repeat-containing protein [Clostridia bacterium]
MNRVSKGKRYDGEPKLNIKKVAATILVVIAVIMVIASIKNALTKEITTKEISVQTTYFTVYANDKWGVIDNKGKEIIPLQYDEMIIIPDKNKDVFVCTQNVDYENSIYDTKILNSKNQEILNEYEKVEAIENHNQNNIWYETSVLKYESNGKYGLIGFDGKLVLSPEFEKIYSLAGTEKSIIIEKEGKKGLTNSLGEIIIQPEYTDIVSLTENYTDGYIVKNAEGKYGIISADKRVILETKYDLIDHASGNNMYAVNEAGQYKIILATGETVLNANFDKAISINGDNIIIERAGKYGIINNAGADIIPAEYEYLSYCFENNYIAKKDGKYGVISTDGVAKVAFKYTTMDYVKNGNFIQADNEQSKTEIINKNFETVFSDIIISEINTEKGYLRIRQNDEYKYYNFNFEEKTPQEALPTRTLFLVKENGKYGYENNNGDRIVDCKYDDAKEQNEYGYCAVKKDGVWGVLKSNGAVIVEPSINLDSNLYIDFIAEWHLHEDLILNIYTK